MKVEEDGEQEERPVLNVHTFAAAEQKCLDGADEEEKSMNFENGEENAGVEMKKKESVADVMIENGDQDDSADDKVDMN